VTAILFQSNEIDPSARYLKNIQLSIDDTSGQHHHSISEPETYPSFALEFIHGHYCYLTESNIKILVRNLYTFQEDAHLQSSYGPAPPNEVIA
jgi:hypothetical protein